MSASGFFRLDEPVPDVAVGYVPRTSPDAPWRTNVFSVPVIGGADGGSHSTARDLDRFLHAYADGSLLGPSQDVVLARHAGRGRRFLLRVRRPALSRRPLRPRRRRPRRRGPRRPLARLGDPRHRPVQRRGPRRRRPRPPGRGRRPRPRLSRRRPTGRRATERREPSGTESGPTPVSRRNLATEHPGGFRQANGRRRPQEVEIPLVDKGFRPRGTVSARCLNELMTTTAATPIGDLDSPLDVLQFARS